ncbi:MAG: NPCBM/NEW2 domain-containing protein [Thermoguttaceae bacterium]|nr:NPCBM/NEW2 domain-containing protein [Thermoguttaceae bacterium]
MKKTFLAIFVLSAVLSAAPLWGLTPNQEEMDAKQRFAAAKFQPAADQQPPLPRITVIQNNDPVLLNYEGKPLKIGETELARGLYCHAVSHLQIELDRPAVRFQAKIGVNTDVSTHHGAGSVVFIVSDGDKELFRSEVMRGTQPAVSVDLPLEKLTRVSLMITDAGDGISCDHADWGEASVTLDDGRTLWLDEIPLMQNGETDTYSPDFPFSFVYGGKPSRAFLKSWNRTDTVETKGEITHRTILFSEPNGPLQVRCEVKEYLDFPAVEWELFFKNTGSGDTPIIESILPLDTHFRRPDFTPKPTGWWEADFGVNKYYNRQHEFLLHHVTGSLVRIDDWMPLETPLPAGASCRLTTAGGRPVNLDAPYFNIQAGNEGWIAVLGWPGQWSAEFSRVGGNGLRVAAGQELTHFKLLPGEEVRSPIAVVMPYFRQSWLEGQNIWRSWMIRHNIPRRADGSFVDHHLAACSSHWFEEMTQATAETQKFFIDRYLEEGMKLDYWWMDAGWYPCDDFWVNTGTWRPDPKRFPNGLREVSDHGHGKGVKTIVWFEPERVSAKGEWFTQYPDWLLLPNEGPFMNMGIPEAREMVTDTIDRLIKNEGIDLYRQDYNFDPLDTWRRNDAEDRQGITEIKYVTGYLAYWDALLQRNPMLRIDSCAGGGKRDELEAMRRAVPEIRSDYILEPVGNQNHILGISLWIPYHGSGIRAMDDYGIRSILSPYLNLCYDMRDRSIDYSGVRRNLDIWEKYLVPMYGKDFYPLAGLTDRDSVAAGPSDVDTIWCGWQYDDPENGTGVIQMFRRDRSRQTEGLYPLFGLDRGAVYEFTDVDTGQTWEYSGQTLRDEGLPIRIENAPQAVILAYKKK